METLPYRQGVGVMLVNRRKRIWMGERMDTQILIPNAPAWQMPQGGIDEGETPEKAALRELQEETGASRVRILAQAPRILFYDLPESLLGKVLKGFRGQKQRWFLMDFQGRDSDFNLSAHPPAEFRRWNWVAPKNLLERTVPFKRKLYQDLLEIFADFL